MIDDIIKKSIELKQSILLDNSLHKVIYNSIDVIVNAFENGNKVMFCGNGGSAADAQHLAAELSGRFYKDRKALPSDALHCNTSYLTAVSNERSYAKPPVNPIVIIPFSLAVLNALMIFLELPDVDNPINTSLSFIVPSTNLEYITS